MVDLGNNNHIEYIYDAAGIKLQQRVYKNGDLQKEMDYVGNFVYENGSLAFIITDEGRLVPKEGENGGYEYEYFIKDHLGNTRVTVKDNSGTAEVVQESHYYPFGMQMGKQSTPLEEGLNKYLYNGKELQDDLGLDWYDYGFRYYDSQLGRWHVKDPMIELHCSNSPYTYVYNNPMNFIDPRGLDTTKREDGIVVVNGNTVTAHIYGNSSSSNVYYLQVTSNTLIKYQDGKRPEYAFIPPQNRGKWGEPGSDGLIHIGCMACHGLNGAYRYAAYHSAERHDGYVIGSTLFMLGASYILLSSQAIKVATKEATAVESGSLEITAKNASVSEVRAANYMKEQGFKVELRDPVGTRAGGGTSDLLVDGVAYDVYTPTSTNPNRIISAIAKKNTQTSGIVLDLSNTSVTESQLGNILKRVQGAGATNITDVRIIGGN